MRTAIAILLAAFAFHAHSAVIRNNFATTNTPTVLTNVVKSMGSNVVASAALNGANVTAGTIPNTALNFVGATNGGPLPAANLTGSVADARLSSNIPLLNATSNHFTGNLTVNSNLTVNGDLNFPGDVNVGALYSQSGSSGVMGVRSDGLIMPTNSIYLIAGTRTFSHDSTHTVITNTATLTSTEFTSGSQKEWYNGATTITVDKTNGLITANGFSFYTNLFTINSAVTIGKSYSMKSGAATGGITGVANSPTSTEFYSEIAILTSGDLVFTNPVAFYASDGLDSRTFTNGNLTKVSVGVIPGLSTNLVFSWSR